MIKESGIANQLLKSRQVLFCSFLVFLACSRSLSVNVPRDKFEYDKGLKFFEPFQLTAGSESNFSPDLSPDGTYILYTSDRSGNKDIWRKKSSGGFAKPLSFHSADDLAPVMSPDGKRIAFVSRRQDAAGDIHIMGTKGEKKAGIRGVKHPLYEDSEPAWFPDGERILFASRAPGSPVPMLMTADLSSLLVKPLGSVKGTQARVFPSGKQIIYVNQGSLYVYDEITHRSRQITQANGPQDGQPFIAQDGKTILFIRYTDDTNSDGIINADDRATIWSLDLQAQGREGLLENYSLIPLTSAKISAYNPQFREKKLYFTKQTGFGLDIYYLPTYGQIGEPRSLGEVENWFHRLTDPDDKTYLLRRSSASFYNKGEKELAAELALRELNWQVELNHRLEAKWVYQKLTANFSSQKELLLLAKLSTIELALAPLAVGEDSKDQLKDLLVAANEIRDLAKKNQYRRALAKSFYVSARIKAALGQHFAASQIFAQVVNDFPDMESIAAKSMYEQGKLLPGLSGQDTAIAKLTELIARYPEQTDVLMKASILAVSLVENSKKPEAAIHLLRSQNLDLPILPAYAHLRIAERFSQAKKDIVAANEYRAMIELYPNSPKILLTAAQRLASIVEREGRIDEAETIIYSLWQQFKEAKSEYLQEAEDLLIALLSRKGEGLIRDNVLSQALETYESIIELNPDDLNGYRGMIKVQFLQGKLESVLDNWDQVLKRERSLTALYSLAYAKTFQLEHTESLGQKVTIIEEAIEMLEQVRDLNDQLPQVHQTLGWLYQQNDFWLEQYERKGGLAGVFGEDWNTFNLFKVVYLSLDFRVLNPFRDEPKNLLELSVDSYLAAYHLTKPHSVARAHLAQNLAHTYYSLGNFKKALYFYSERIAEIKVIPVEPLAAEALFWQRAGRSAFQVGENQLAAALQKKALLIWEQAGYAEPLAHTIDSLALSLAELNANLKAQEYYLKLLAEHRKNKRYKNLNKVYINLALTYRNQEDFPKALAMLDEADQVFIDYSLPKEFSIHQKLISNSLRISMFEKSGYHRLQHDALVKKVELLEEKFSFGKDQGKPDTYLFMERSIAYNQLGNLYKRDGNWQKGIESFQKALEIAALKRAGQDKKLAAGEELANLLSLGRMELVRLESGIHRPKNLESLLARIDRELDLIYPTEKAQTETTGALNELADEKQKLKSLPQQTFPLVSLKGMLLSYKSQYGSKHDTELKNPILLSLEQSMDRSFDLAVVQKQLPRELPSLYLAWKQGSYESHVSSQALASIAPVVKQSFSRNHYSFWKYMTGVSDWKEASNALESYLLAGGVLESYTDRRLARKTYESLYLKNKPKGFLSLFKDYQALKYREMLWRTYYWNTRSQNKEEKRRYLQSFKERYDDLLRVKDLEDIMESLGPHEAVLAVHKFAESDRVWFAWLDAEEIQEKIQILPVGEPFESTFELIKQFPLVERGIKQLYIIPSEELYAQNWEAIYRYSPYLKKEGGISFLPSFDVLPIITERSFSGRYYLGITSRDAQTQQEGSYEGYLQFNIDPIKSENLAFELSSYQIVQSTGVLKLNSFEPNRSEWFLTPPGPRDASANSLRLRDFANIVEHDTAAIIFPEVEYLRDDELQDQSLDAWAAMWFAAFTRGTTSLVLGSPLGLEKAGSKDSKKIRVDSLTKFYEKAQGEPFSLAIKHSGLPLRSIGYEALLDEEIIEELADEALELFEEYQDEGEFSAARSQLLKLIYFYKQGEMEDEFWESMGQLSWLFYRLKEFDKALLVQKLVAESVLSREEDEVSYAENLMNAANFAHLAEDYDESNRLLKVCERIFNEEEDFISTANVWHLRAVNAEKKGKYQKAINAYNKSLELFMEEGEEIEAAKKYRAIGTIYQIRLNSYGKALAYFRQAAEILLELEEEKVLALVYIETANTYIAMGQTSGAIQLLKQASQMIDEEEEPILKIRALQNLGIAYFRRNLLLDAQNSVDKNFMLIDELDDDDPIKAKIKKRLYIDALNLEGMIAAKKGQKNRSFETFEKALELARKNNFAAKVAFILNNYGFWSREFGQLEASIEYMEEALKIDKQRKVKTDEAFDLRNLGLSAIVLGQRERARDLLMKALKISGELGISYNLIYCHIGVGDLAFLDQRWGDARKHYNNGLSEARSKHIDDFVWKAETAIAKTYLQESSIENAKSALQSALKLIGELPPGLISQSSSTGLSTEMGVQAVYEQMMKVLLLEKNYQKAWVLSEEAKLRQMVDSLGFLNLPYSKKQSVELVQEIKKLKNQILNHKVKLDSELRKRSDAFQQWQRENKTLLASYQQKISTLEKSDSDASAFLKVKTASLSQVRKKIGVEQGLVSYFILPDELLIFLLSRNEFTLKRVKVEGETLKRKLADFSTIMEHYSAIHFMANNLFDLLLRPLEQSLVELKSLGLSPHKYLHQLAFASLFDGKQFLLERFDLFFLESLSSVIKQKKQPHRWSSGQTRIMAFADPLTEDQEVLPFARREVEALTRYFKKVDTFVGKNAKKSHLQKLKGGYDILHIASHGKFVETAPQMSSLQFSGPPNDSKLRTQEVFSLRSMPYLVTLSACESGLNNLNQGEPSIGLERAFFYAGARALVSSLWRIDDVASAVVMKRFYRYLSEGLPLSAALQKSQMHVKEYFEHPAYWASFKLSGSFH